MFDLVDIGANLTHDSFDSDREQVLERAAESGVNTLIVTGSSVEASRQAVALAHAHPGRLYATAGIHPHHAKDFRTGDEDALDTLLADSVTVAAGECGLDFFRNFSTPSQQEEVFDLQLSIAARRDVPGFSSPA